MKRLIIIPLLFLSLSLGATKWYVHPGGSDTHGKGTLTDQWKTYKHAADTITGATFVGDTIFFDSGTYTETTQISHTAGISLMGVGDASKLVLTYVSSSSSSGCIQLSSAPTEGTNGNQSISYLYIDGDLTGTIGIVVYCRSNVKVHHCTIIDFAQCGVTFRGNAVSGEATIKATGNQVYNCSIINSSSRTGGVSDGLIRLYSQTNMDIHDNILNQTGRAQGDNGNIIDAVGGYNSNIRYYKNKSYKPYTEGASQWNFHIESWNGQGGWNVYDNEFHGGGCHIDVGGNTNVKGAFAYSWWIHDNLFTQDSLQPYNVNGYYTMGVDLERAVSDAIIERNIFNRLSFGIEITTDAVGGTTNARIRYNLFREIGSTDNVFCAAILLNQIDAGSGISGIYIDNNTMTAGNAYNVGAGLITGIWSNTINEIYFRNNITEGFYRGPIWISTGNGQVDSLYYQNNLSNNTNNSIYYSTGETITKLKSSGNVTGNPLFKSNETFRLRPTSPAINAGINVSLATDYWGHKVPQNGTPDIGACEYGNYVLFYNGKQLY